jgi:hypothetical protein
MIEGILDELIGPARLAAQPEKHSPAVAKQAREYGR